MPIKFEKLEIFLYIVAGLLFAAPIAFFCSIFVLIPIAQEARLKMSLDVFHDAEYIWSDQGDQGFPSTGTKSAYFWTSDSVETVQQYYEVFTPPFLSSEDAFGRWSITATNADFTVSKTNPNHVLGHRSFCDWRQHYDCVSIVLIDFGQSNWYETGAASVTGFRRDQEPTAFISLPNQGTLIIFTYDLWGE